MDRLDGANSSWGTWIGRHALGLHGLTRRVGVVACLDCQQLAKDVTPGLCKGAMSVAIVPHCVYVVFCALLVFCQRDHSVFLYRCPLDAKEYLQIIS
ncbi:hypothetical protein OG21DRAFT_1514111 [Imleria badia]|nr:hypothetical protein OG21DRAFT_1514111 [Imleria badia]